MASTNDLRILVAETNPAMRDMAAKLLERAGFSHVGYATKPKEIILALAKHEADFLLMDWRLAEAGNFALVKHIRKEKRLAATPILVMARETSAEQRVAAARAGVWHILPAPFDEGSLRRGIETVLEAGKDKNVGAAAGGQSVGADPRDPVAGGAVGAIAGDSPEDIEAKKLFRDAYANLRRRKYADAMKGFALALKKNPLFPEAYKGIAEAFIHTGQDKKAAEFMNMAAENYVMLDRDETAQGLYKEVKKRDPEAKSPFKSAAKKLRQQGDLQRAVGALQKGVEVDPKDVELHEELVDTLEEQGRQDEAVAAAENALAKGLGGAPEEGGGRFGDYIIKVKGEDFYAKVTGARGVQQILEEEGPDYDGPEKRGCPRIPLADYFVQLKKAKEGLAIVDMSETGVAFKVGDAHFQEGQEFTFDLSALEDVKIKKVACRVRRVHNGVAGCQFLDLDDKQKKALMDILIKEDKEGEFKVSEKADFNIGGVTY